MPSESVTTAAPGLRRRIPAPDLIEMNDRAESSSVRNNVDGYGPGDSTLRDFGDEDAAESSPEDDVLDPFSNSLGQQAVTTVLQRHRYGQWYLNPQVEQQFLIYQSVHPVVPTVFAFLLALSVVIIPITSLRYAPPQSYGIHLISLFSTAAYCVVGVFNYVVHRLARKRHSGHGRGRRFSHQPLHAEESGGLLAAPSTSSIHSTDSPPNHRSDSSRFTITELWAAQVCEYCSVALLVTSFIYVFGAYRRGATYKEILQTKHGEGFASMKIHPYYYVGSQHYFVTIVQLGPLLFMRLRGFVAVPIVLLLPIALFLGRPEDAMDPYPVVAMFALLQFTFTISIVLGFVFSDLFQRRRFEAWVLSRVGASDLRNRRDAINTTISNLLPPHALTELLANQPVIAARRQASVCVTRIDNFLSWSCSVLPVAAVYMVDTLFSRFDTVVAQRFGAEKLKTTGNTYVAGYGVQFELPPPSAQSPVRRLNATTSSISPVEDGLRSSNHLIFVQMALWQHRFATRLAAVLELDKRPAHEQFHIAIGIHTGHCIGGVFGTRRVWYDCYGDAFDGAYTLGKIAAKYGGILISASTKDVCGEQTPFVLKRIALTDLGLYKVSEPRGDSQDSFSFLPSLVPVTFPIVYAVSPNRTPMQWRGPRQEPTLSLAPAATEVGSSSDLTVGEAELDEVLQSIVPALPNPAVESQKDPFMSMMLQIVNGEYEAPFGEDGKNKDPIGASRSTPTTRGRVFNSDASASRVEATPNVVHRERFLRLCVERQRKDESVVAVHSQPSTTGVAVEDSNAGKTTPQGSAPVGADPVATRSANGVTPPSRALAISRPILREDCPKVPADDENLFNAETKAQQLEQAFAKAQEATDAGIWPVLRFPELRQQPSTNPYARFQGMGSTWIEDRYRLHLLAMNARYSAIRTGSFLLTILPALLIVWLEGAATWKGVALMLLDMCLVVTQFLAINRWNCAIPALVETTLTVPVCVIAMFATAQMEDCSLNSHAFIMWAALVPYMFFSTRRTGWAYSAVCMTLITLSAAASAYLTSDIYFFPLLMIPSMAGALISGAVFWERDQRSFFKHLTLSAVMLEAAEKELFLQRALLRTIVPDCVLEAVADKCRVKDGHGRAIAHQLDETTICCIRVPALYARSGNTGSNSQQAKPTPLSQEAAAVPDWETSLKKLTQSAEHRMRFLEDLVSQCPHLEIVNSLGDCVLIGGPLHQSKKPLKQEQSVGSPVDPFGLKIHDGPENSEVALREAAWGVLNIVEAILSEKSRRWAAVLNAGSEFACVIGQERPAFDLIGPTTRTAYAILDAAPPNCFVMTRSFRQLLFHEPPHSIAEKVAKFDQSRLGDPQRWRCAAAGVVYVSSLARKSGVLDPSSNGGLRSEQIQ